MTARPVLLMLLAASGCAPAANSLSSAELAKSELATSDAGGLKSAATALADREPYSAGLQWMLERTEGLEVPGIPCLMAPMKRAPWIDDPAVNRRVKDVRSDSYWLGRWAKENLGSRLAYAEVTYDLPEIFDGTFPDKPPPLIYAIAVTGTAKISPPPLGDRAKNVPVKVIYDVPLSHDEFLARREIGGETTQKLLDWQGEGGSPSTGWAVRLSVYSKDGKPDPAALAHCDTLRRAYGLPVLMEFSSARMSDMEMISPQAQ